MTPGLLLFGLFPLLGVWSAANPTADLLAYAVLLAAALFAMEDRHPAFACATAAGLMVHQAFYPFYGAMALVCATRGMRWRYVFASGVPFALYYVAIAIQKHNINWILAFHLAMHTPKSGDLPIFDGLLGTMLRGSAKYVLKSCILVGSFVASIALSIYSARHRNWLMLCLCLPVVLAGIFSTQNVAWVVFRLSKLLVFPACLWISKRPTIIQLLEWPPVYAAAALLLAASQFAWAHYNIVYALTH
jgi:hypothetical protein